MGLFRILLCIVSRKTQLATYENSKTTNENTPPASNQTTTLARQARVNINRNPMQKTVFKNPNTLQLYV